MSKKKLQITAIFLVITLLAVLIPQHQARAGSWWDPTSWPGTAVNYFTAKIVSATVGEIVMNIGTLVVTVEMSAIKWAAELLDGFISLQTNYAIYDITVVTGSWTIIRNFVNLFFILVLIIMAFGTIFDIQKYTWRNMLPSFLIAALLINFSLAIGQYIITVANGLSSIFLKEVQKAAVGGISAAFAQGAGIAGGATIDTVAGIYVQAMFSVVFLGIFMLALLATALFSLARMFMLWFLLIISPIAWFGYTMPGLRGQTWSAWWKHFLCWCFWLPYFLFFVMFAVIFINTKGTLPMPAGFMSNVGNSVGFYVLSLIFLIGGMFMARKLACASGTGVSMAFGKIETGVRKYAPGAAYVRAKYTGAKEGLAERGAEIQEKGMFGIGGAQKARLQQAEAKGFVAAISKGQMPFDRARIEKEKVAMVEIEKEGKRVREQLQMKPAGDQKDFLLAQKSKAGLAGQAATLEFVKQGYSNLDDYKESATRYGGENSAFMRQYLENIKQAKLNDLFKSPDEELRIARGGDDGETIALVNLRRELYKDLAKRDRVNSPDVYKEAKQLLSPIPAELKSFLDSVKPEYMFGTKQARQEALLNFGSKEKDQNGEDKDKLKDADLAKKLVDYMKDKKEISDYENKETGEKASGWQIREKALEVVGNKESFEGKGIVNEINKFNPVINIEAEMRTAPGAKPFLDNEELITKIQDELKGKSFEDIKKMSGAFFKDPAVQEAMTGYDRQQDDFEKKLLDGREKELKRMYDPKEIADMLRGASSDMRKALKDFATPGKKAREPRETAKPTEKEAPQIEVITPTGENRRTPEEQAEREQILRDLGRIP